MISEAGFSFKMAVDICNDNFKTNPAEGKVLYSKFLKFVIESYISLGQTYKYSQSTVEYILKVAELRSYIKAQFVEKILVYFLCCIDPLSLHNVEK